MDPRAVEPGLCRELGHETMLIDQASQLLEESCRSRDRPTGVRIGVFLLKQEEALVMLDRSSEVVPAVAQRLAFSDAWITLTPLAFLEGVQNERPKRSLLNGLSATSSSTSAKS